MPCIARDTSGIEGTGIRKIGLIKKRGSLDWTSSFFCAPGKNDSSGNFEFFLMLLCDAKMKNQHVPFRDQG
jgi:hypothetical protein